MKTFTRNMGLIALSTAIGLSGYVMAQQDTDVSQALRELDIMSNIFEAATDQSRDNNNGGRLTSFDEAMYLADQGMVFSFRMRSGRNFFFGPDFNEIFLDGARMEIQIANLQNEISTEVMRDLDAEFQMPPTVIFNGGMDEEQMEAMEEMMDAIRDHQENIRDQQREIRSLQRQLRNDDDADVESIENQIVEIEAQLEAEMEELDTQSTAYANSMLEYREAQQQQITQRNQLALDEIMTTLCDYGSTLRSLQSDEHVTIVLQNFNDNSDQVYVFSAGDVASCSSGEQLLQTALGYQL